MARFSEGDKVFYDDRPVVITKVKDVGTHGEHYEFEFMNEQDTAHAASRRKTNDHDPRLMEREGESQPSMHSVLTQAAKAIDAAKVKARSNATVTVKPKGGKRGTEVEIELDGFVLAALEDAFGDDVERVKLEIVDVDGLDRDAVKELGRFIEVEDLDRLGMLVDEHDNDLVSAAIIAADGDVGHAETLANEGVEWIGGAREDEDDYVYYVIEEGLMGDKLGDYFDYESFGRDLVMDVSSIEINGRLIVFHR